MTEIEVFTKYPYLENIQTELTQILNENDYLRAENERLKDYERKYNQLLRDNINHNNEMIATMITSCLDVPKFVSNTSEED